MYPEKVNPGLRKPLLVQNRQAGLGLPAALFIIIILSLLVLAITELETSSGESVSMNILSTRAFYAAESGAQIALVELFPPGAAENDCSAVSNNLFFTQQALANCTAAINCREDVAEVSGIEDTYFTITSTGTCASFASSGPGIPQDAAQRRIQMRAH